MKWKEQEFEIEKNIKTELWAYATINKIRPTITNHLI